MRFIVFMVLLVAALPAQAVSPGHFRRAEGNSRTGAGLGLTALACRHLQIHGDSIGAPMTIGGLALRRDGGATESYAVFGILCTLSLSTARTGAGAPAAIFDDNHGLDRVQVIPPGPIGFPATLPGLPPRPFEYVLPFSTPFVFGGQGPLCWDLLVLGRGNAFAVDLDAVDGVDLDPPAPSGSRGEGCLATGQTGPFALRARADFDWPKAAGFLRYQGLRGPAGGIGHLYIGIEGGVLPWLPMPYELPGTRQSPSGPCWLYQTPFWVLPVAFDPLGQSNTGVGLFLDASLHGSTLISQLLAIDMPANNWHIVFSDNAWIHIVAPWLRAWVGEVSTDAAPFATGAPRAGHGAVVQFR